MIFTSNALHFSLITKSHAQLWCQQIILIIMKKLSFCVLIKWLAQQAWLTNSYAVIGYQSGKMKLSFPLKEKGYAITHYELYDISWRFNFSYARF